MHEVRARNSTTRKHDWSKVHDLSFRFFYQDNMIFIVYLDVRILESGVKA